MPNATLQIKLHELQAMIELLKHCIQTSEQIDHAVLQVELSQLRQDYAVLEANLHDKLTHSKSQMVTLLSDAYDSLVPILLHTKQTVLHTMQSEQTPSCEQQLLLAEYELDFAMLTVQCAMIAALEAIATQQEDAVQPPSQQKGTML